MTKRLTETQKWVDPWFRRLPPEFKLAWIYLTDNCDCAGVIDLDRELASFQIGFDVQWEKFFVEAGERIRKLASGKIWVTQFVAFQQGCDELNPENRFHRGIISRLLAAGINHAEFQGPSKPLASPKQGATKGQARPPIYIRKQDNKITVKQENKKRGKGGKEAGKRVVSYSSDFQTFWDVYPSRGKSGKETAQVAFEKAIRKTTLETLIAAAGEYAESHTGQNEYCKHAATWLNGGCWDDDRMAWKCRQPLNSAEKRTKQMFDMMNQPQTVEGQVNAQARIQSDNG